MTKRKKKPGKTPPSYYQLSEVIQKIDNGEYFINPDVLRDALKDFGWGLADIIKAYKMLQPKHFQKDDGAKFDPGIVVEVYKAHIMARIFIPISILTISLTN